MGPIIRHPVPPLHGVNRQLPRRDREREALGVSGTRKHRLPGSLKPQVRGHGGAVPRHRSVGPVQQAHIARTVERVHHQRQVERRGLPDQSRADQLGCGHPCKAPALLRFAGHGVVGDGVPGQCEVPDLQVCAVHGAHVTAVIDAIEIPLGKREWHTPIGEASRLTHDRDSARRCPSLLGPVGSDVVASVRQVVQQLRMQETDGINVCAISMVFFDNI